MSTAHISPRRLLVHVRVESTMSQFRDKQFRVVLSGVNCAMLECQTVSKQSLELVQEGRWVMC